MKSIVETISPLKRIIENNDTKRGRVVDLMIQSLVVFSLVTFSIETLPDLSDAALRWLHYAEVVTVGIFTIEYLPGKQVLISFRQPMVVHCNPFDRRLR